MKIETINRTIKVKVVTFKNNMTIDASVVMEFLDESYDFVDTIGKESNYTDSYLYFESLKEKELEKVLLEYNVIRLAPNQELHNRKVGTSSHYTCYRYWLSNGYRSFCKEFYKLYY